MAMLDKAGVDTSKIRFVEMPFPAMPAALLNKQVEAVTPPDPFTTVLLSTGQVEALGWIMADTAPGGDVTQYIALSSWTKKSPDIATRFVNALRKAAEFAEINEVVVRNLSVEFARLSPDLKDKVILPQFGKSVNLPSFEERMRLMLKYGLLSKPVDMSQRMFVCGDCDK